MNSKNKLIVAAVAILLVGGVFYFVSGRKMLRKQAAPIKISQTETKQEALNPANRSPLSGLECANWNRRPVSVMQPSDLQARPAAGFSDADMVFEMPAFTSSVTRLLGVYTCNIPDEVGAIRSSRHDYIALAKGIDALFIHWGGSHFALDLLKQNVIDNYDCMTGGYCERWEVSGKMRVEDTGHIKRDNILKMAADKGYRMENNFSGYPHKEEALLENRPKGAHLRVAFGGPYAVEYDYDRESNTFLRTWGNVADTDRNNGKRIAPKNVVVMIAKSEQIMTSQDYVGQGLQDPWANVEEIKKTGVESISGRYNNVQIGDPWYDSSDSGEAFYYIDGQQKKGSWKKDRSKLDSKLFFYDESGQEVQFVPGQIWVEILEPGQTLRWEPMA